MEEYEMKVVIDELLRTIARLKMDSASKEYENSILREGVESLRAEVARLEAVAAEKETAQAS